MTELQLLSLRNQMDPHFTFNVLNTIGSVILQNKSDESYDMLMKFSRMIRTTISSANKICRSLEEELSFVKNYLELQQFRYQGNFMYQIDLDPVVDTRDTVPKMILQTYVENALKHGLLPRKEGGVLKVEIYRRSNYLELSVTDNGVGRQQAKVNGTVSTGVGLTILNQYYQVLNRRNTRPITEEFIDLFDEFGNPAGTRVVVCIPEGFVFPGEIDSR
jgi:LytS/YehU family sensor histidine kinase